MNRRVVVTGLGVVSSIGIGWQDFWENLLKGKSGIGPVTSFDTANHFTHNGGAVTIFEPEEFLDAEQVKFHNRASHFAIASARMALRDSGLSVTDMFQYRIGVCMGTTLGSVQSVEIIDELSVNSRQQDITADLISQVPTHSTPSAIAHEFRLNGPLMMFSTACAAGNYAIGYGFDLIKLSRADIVIAGGSDPFSKVAFTGFNQLSAVAPEKCQPFDKNRKGMMVAEGAGMLILESLDSALSRNAPVYAEILGYGLSCDAGHMTQPSIAGISECMLRAMREANIGKESVDYICAHGTGTPVNDRAECAAIKQVFRDRHMQIPVSSIKSMLGHTMGAASALESIATALSLKNDIIPPTINYETPDPECDIDCVPNIARRHIVNIALNNSYAFGGNNASLVLKKYGGVGG